MCPEEAASQRPNEGVGEAGQPDFSVVVVDFPQFPPRIAVEPVEELVGGRPEFLRGPDGEAHDHLRQIIRVAMSARPTHRALVCASCRVPLPSIVL